MICEHWWIDWLGTDFFLTGQEVLFFAMVVGWSMYAGFSLLGKRTHFNLDKMLHRGEYVVASERRMFPAPADLGPELTAWDEPPANIDLTWSGTEYALAIGSSESDARMLLLSIPSLKRSATGTSLVRHRRAAWARSPSNSSTSSSRRRPAVAPDRTRRPRRDLVRPRRDRHGDRQPTRRARLPSEAGTGRSPGERRPRRRRRSSARRSWVSTTTTWPAVPP